MAFDPADVNDLASEREALREEHRALEAKHEQRRKHRHDVQGQVDHSGKLHAHPARLHTYSEKLHGIVARMSKP